MKILITGAHGMLGRSLIALLGGEHILVPVDIDTLDITCASDVDTALRTHAPDTVIHCAAMTAVDACENQKDDAFRVNAIGSGNIAISCHRQNTRLFAISTDYVFSGDSERPYHEWDTPNPISVYGRSKLAGESLIRAHCPDHVILRTEWLYGPGGPSFLHTMLHLGNETGDPLRVVSDQFGAPTSTFCLAALIKTMIPLPVAGTFHATCEGEVSWYEFAKEIFQRWGLSREITPCTTDQYPRPAPRPRNSRLENRALRLHGLPPMPHWRDALAYFQETRPNG